MIRRVRILRVSARVGRLVVVVSLLLHPAVAKAQVTGIGGVVSDSSGAALPGVTVEASSPALIEGVRTTVSGADGRYRIADLRPGQYTVTFALSGFSTLRREGISLSGSFTATVDAVLEIGAIEETVTVTSQAPVVDTRNVVQQAVLSDAMRAELPTARSIQTMAQLIPGMQNAALNRPSGQDAGGLSGERGQVMIHGSRNGDMTLQLDGLNWALATINGSAQGYTLNPAEAEEFVYEVAGLAPEVMAGGVRVNVIPKEGGNRFAGSFLASYANGSVQSDNLTTELEERGLSAANPLDYVYDINPSFGGPLREGRLWFFGSFRQWGNREQVTGLFRAVDFRAPIYVPDPNNPAYYGSWLRSYGLRLTWQVTQKNKLSVYGAHQPRLQDGQFISVNRSYEAAFQQAVSLNYMTQASWKSTVSSKLLFEAAGQVPYTSTPIVGPSYVPDDLASITDTGRGLIYRSVPVQSVPYYFQPSVRAALSYVTGSHAAKFGIEVGWGHQHTTNTRANTGQNLVFVNGTPRQVIVHLVPRDIWAAFHSVALFAQDQWTLRRLTFNGGLRFDLHNESLPESTTGPSLFTPFRVWPEVKDVVDWKDISPRLGVAYDVFGDGKTAIKGTISRYVVRDMTGFAANNNPALANATATRTWTDDGDYIPEESELGPLSNRNFGTDVSSLRVDDAIRSGWGVRPNNWEISAGIQRELLPNVSLGVTYFQRWFDNFTVTDNLSVEPTDYDPYCILAPVDSRLPGGGGDEICGLYDLNPSKLGQVNNFNTFASSYGDRKETFRGIDGIVNARLPRGMRVFGGVSSGTSNLTGNALTNSSDACFVVDSPQALRFCEVNVPWRTQVRALVSFERLPGATSLAVTLQSNPGPEILANYSVTSAATIGLGRPLTSGTATIPLIKPGTVFGDRINQVDIRLGRTFSVGTTKIRALLDLYNVFNASAVLLQNNSYGSAWLRPGYIMPGRLFKPTIEVIF